MRMVTEDPERMSGIDDLRRMFAFLEANAEDFWSVPDLDSVDDR